MASVEIAQDTEADLPVVEYVATLNKRVVDEGTVDPFARKAEELKELNLDGQSSTFKASVTRNINKVREGTGGAKSKMIHEDKEWLTGYDTYGVIQPPHNLDALCKLYQISPPHYAAVNAKVSNIVGLGYKFVESRKTKKKLEKVANNASKTKKINEQLADHRAELEEMFENFNKETSFVETLIRVWRDYEVTGNGYIEIGRKKDGSIGYVGHIPAQTMRIRRKRDGFVQMTGFKVQFFANYGDAFDDNGKRQRITNPIGNGEPNEVIHIMKYDPNSGYYGVPDILAAQQAVAGNKFAGDYNLDYFENKAVPRYAIVLKGATLSANAEDALLSFFETSLKGQNHRSIFIPLPAHTKDNPVDLEFKAIETGNQDASFVNYKKENTTEILMVHRVPITKISISANASLAIARDADKTFKEQVCGPEQKIFEKKISAMVLEITDAFDFVLNQMTLTDEDTQSKIDERDVKNGIVLANEVRAGRGLPAIEGGDERVNLNAKGGTAADAARDGTANRNRDAERSAAASDSAGEARQPKGEGRASP